MGIQSRMPTIICDVCGYIVECVEYSKEYNMLEVRISGFHQSGSGASPYELLNKEKHIICYECYSKILEESPTFEKLVTRRSS